MTEPANVTALRDWRDIEKKFAPLQHKGVYMEFETVDYLLQHIDDLEKELKQYRVPENLLRGEIKYE